MKRILIALLFLVHCLAGKKSSACTCAYMAPDFITSLNMFYFPDQGNTYIFKGVLTGSVFGEAGTYIKVLDQYYGSTALPDTIFYRAGNGVSCYGYLSWATGDTIIASFWKEDTADSLNFNPPLATGNFKNFLCDMSTILVQGDSVYGGMADGFTRNGFPLNKFMDTLNQTLQHSSTAIEPIAKEGDQITIYPNPATEILEIALLENVIPEHIIIYDSKGHSVYGQKAMAGTRQKVNIANLASGLFILHLRQKDGQVKRFRFIKR